MSKRKRNAQKQSDFTHIEWLKHRTGYPTPEERVQLIQMRQELTSDILELMLAGIGPDSPQARELEKKYGKPEMERATKKLDETMELPAFVADEAKSYREYRLRYAHFGEGLKFYSAKEIEELFDERFKELGETGNFNEATELDKLLIFGWRDWEDITPPAVPVCPDDFRASQPASYPAPINELLEWGDDLNRIHGFVDETDFINWRKHIPALTRMALDPGLLNGWVTDKESWAPWHAIHVLGTLQAWESAPALAKLADLENDWLSDHLPHIWAGMGMEVEPSLWMILEDPMASAKQRGLAAQSLFMMTDEEDDLMSDAMMDKVIKGFEKILKDIKSFDPTVNAYLIHFLNEMDMVEEVWDAVIPAFEENRVDLDIITLEDLGENDNNED